MTKKAITICIGIIIFFLCGNIGFAEEHYYLNGIVTSITPAFIKISANESIKEFSIASQCNVSIHYKKAGAFYIKPATFSDVAIGSWVTVKVVGFKVTEILIERYKK